MYSSLGKQLLSFNLAGGQEVCVHVLFGSPTFNNLLLLSINQVFLDLNVSTKTADIHLYMVFMSSRLVLILGCRKLEEWILGYNLK